MPSRLTLQERIELVLIYGEYRNENDSGRKAANHFNEAHPNRVVKVAHTTVLSLIQRFKQTGHVDELKGRGPKRTATDEANETDVLAMFAVNSQLSTRRASLESDTSDRSVRRILRRNRLHPYKFFLTQELIPEDLDLRLEFAENMLHRIATNNNFPSLIVFSD